MVLKWRSLQWTLENRFHGYGTHTLSNGVVYEGNFLHGERIAGKLVIPNGGGIYTGHFKDDIFHGKGIFLRNGEVFEGEFVDGKKVN